MDLNFLDKLTKEEIVILINCCIDYINALEETKIIIKEPHIERVVLWNEVDRRDIYGNRYIQIKTSNGDYIANDFYMSSTNVVNPHLNVDLSAPLRVFMTKRFGERYIKALFNMRVGEAEVESERLSEYLNNGRKKKKKNDD